MSGKALLDTNAIIAIFAGDPDAIRVVQGHSDVFLCVPVLGELRYGALASSRVQENLRRLDEFAHAIILLHCDAGTSAFYAELKFELRQKGRPIPENDVWIAAIARQHGLTLISRDTHFQEVDGLDFLLM